MRILSYQTVIIIFFILTAIELISFCGLYNYSKKILVDKKRWIYASLYWLLSLAVIVLFFLAFAKPDTAGSSSHYLLSNIAIATLFLNLFPKFVLSIFTLLSFAIRFINKAFSRIFYTSGLILTLGTFLTISFGIFIGKEDLRVEKISLEIPNLPAQANKLKIVQLSDIHLGSFLENNRLVTKTIQKVNELNPDLILFTGDMVNNFADENTGYVDILKNLKAKYGKFAITGNHDYGDYTRWTSVDKRNENLNATKDSIRKMGFELLLNENRKLVFADTCLYVAGVENWGHAPFPQYAKLDSALKQIPDNAFTILMSHDPAHWEAQVTEKTNIPLTLSGHTHGGQFGFRIAGIEFSPMYLIQKYWGGLYQKGNQFLYVNRGLGRIGFNGRIEMRPEITLITLTNHQSPERSTENKNSN